MGRFGQKKRITDYLYTKPVIAVLLIVVVFMATAVYQRFVVERKTAALQEEMENQKAQLIERKGQLEKKVEYLSGERGIEEEIRKHFDVAKEGEQVVILVGQEQPPLPPETKNEPEHPWYMFWR